MLPKTVRSLRAGRLVGLIKSSSPKNLESVNTWLVIGIHRMNKQVPKKLGKSEVHVVETLRKGFKEETDLILDM